MGCMLFDTLFDRSSPDLDSTSFDFDNLDRISLIFDFVLLF